MNLVAFLFCATIVALVLVAAPVAVALSFSRPPASIQVCGWAAQFLPVLLSVAYFEHAETHLSIPLYSYARPAPLALFGIVAAIQWLATIGVLRGFGLQMKEASIGAVPAAAGAIGLSFILQGVVACMNGNCF
jgi:hypothetical protein